MYNGIQTSVCIYYYIKNNNIHFRTTKISFEIKVSIYFEKYTFYAWTTYVEIWLKGELNSQVAMRNLRKWNYVTSLLWIHWITMHETWPIQLAKWRYSTYDVIDSPKVYLKHSLFWVLVSWTDMQLFNFVKDFPLNNLHSYAGITKEK